MSARRRFVYPSDAQIRSHFLRLRSAFLDFSPRWRHGIQITVVYKIL